MEPDDPDGNAPDDPLVEADRHQAHWFKLMKANFDDMIMEYEPGAPITNKRDEQMLRQAVNVHPHAEDIVGPGIAYFKVDIFHPGNTLCFFAVRTDGKAKAFSYVKALRGKPLKPDMLAVIALRLAIANDVRDFKIERFGSGPQHCPECGEALNWDNAEADHKAPETFKKMVDDFMGVSNVKWPDVPFLPMTDDDHFPRLDPAFAKFWRDYHLIFCVLRLVCKKCHRTLLRS